jgi:hypothetical protein
MPEADTEWIDVLAERCKQRTDREDAARELYRLAVSARPVVFEELIKELRFAIEYFRERCEEGRHILHIRSRPLMFEVSAEAPYSSSVRLAISDASVSYWKEILPTPRSKPQHFSGRLLIKIDFHQSFWLEHQGNRLSVGQASQFLLKEFLESLVCRD